MAKWMLAHSNLVDAGAVQDGFWLDSLPLANVQDEESGWVARTPNLDLTSTQLVVDVGPFHLARVVALKGHNLTRYARYRITSSSVSNFAEAGIDTGWLDVWPLVYPIGSLPWGAPNWWDGRYSDGEIGRQTRLLTHILDEDSTDQFWRIEVDDQENPAGYFEVDRVYICPAWSSELNVSWGRALGLEDPSEIVTARSGHEYSDRQQIYRVARVATDWLSDDEAWAQAFEIQRQAGLTRDVIFIWDQAVDPHFIRRTFVARQRKLDLITNPFVAMNKTGWEFKERP
jgi:hypothetical protein